MSSSLVDAPALDNAEACESLVSQIAELHTGSLSDDGNWLTDNDEEADEALYLDREGKRRREEFYNAGYRDGVAAGRNDAAQDGFNQGFKESVMVGYKWGIIRGLTSAFTHIPKDLQLKLVESEDKRENFLNLSEAVNSIGNEDALKLFNDRIQHGASAERSKLIESEASTRPRGCEYSGLESYFGKMDLLLNESVQLKVNKYRVP